MYGVSWAKKSEYGGSNWNDKILKVYDTIHNKTYFVNMDDFESELIEMGCFNQELAEQAINDFLAESLFES